MSTNIKYICTELIKQEEELVVDIEALCGFDWAGLGDWGELGYIRSPKVKLDTVVTLDRLEKGMFRVCVGRRVYIC